MVAKEEGSLKRVVVSPAAKEAPDCVSSVRAASRWARLPAPPWLVSRVAEERYESFT